ncbi:Tn3 family transposase [Dyadobacter bucti]|uniref:Tn3 family transposase n=1 Tax=Dyadobacter bucti TaxID=2572203 RepID=UPI001107DA3B
MHQPFEKTLYTLQYINKLAFRKSVERVLSKVENSNKFAKLAHIYPQLGTY